MTWKLNVDGIHGLKPIQSKDCVLGVLRSKTNKILSPGVKINAHERQLLYTKVESKHPTFQNITKPRTVYISHVLQRQADIHMVGKVLTQVIRYS